MSNSEQRQILQTISLIKSCEVALEVIDDKLFVNTLIHQNDNGTQKQEFELGKDFRLHKGPHGIVLYRAENVYYIDKHGTLKTIPLPKELGEKLEKNYILEQIFEKKGIFIAYKEPENKNTNGVCFLYNTRNHTSLTLKTDHQFHSLIIGNVENIDFFLKDTLRGELRITSGNKVQKAPIKNIHRQDKSGNNFFEAILGILEPQFKGDFFLTKVGASHQVTLEANQRIFFQKQYKILCDKTEIKIFDGDSHREHKINIPQNYNLHKTYFSENGNFFCLLESETKPKHLAISWGNLEHLSSPNLEEILKIDYISLRAANIGACSVNQQQFCFIGKKQNQSREFVILQTGLGKNMIFTYPLKAHELTGETSIEYHDTIYKVNSLHMPANKFAPTLLEYHYFKLNEKSEKVQQYRKLSSEIKQKMETYIKHLESGKSDYESLHQENSELKKLISEIEPFLEQFHLGNAKNIFGKNKEYIDFDPARVIEIYKKIQKLQENLIS